jgi:hypothetical protein
MKYSNLLIAVIFSVFLASCSSNPVIHDDLLKFANSNCFFWYFKSKDLNTDEIKKITSGIVENSQFSADKFQQVAFLVKDYAPAIETKSNVNVQLAKCFVLTDDSEFNVELDKIRSL